MNRSLLTLLIGILAVGCASSRLSDQERSKLDPQLAKLLSGEQVSESVLDASLRADGAKEYGVIIRSTDVQALRSAGIRIGSVLGNVITARVTLAELRTVVSLPTVRAVEIGSRNYPH